MSVPAILLVLQCALVGWALGGVIKSARAAEAGRERRRLRGPPKPPPPPRALPAVRLCRDCGEPLNPIHFGDECPAKESP